MLDERLQRVGGVPLLVGLFVVYVATASMTVWQSVDTVDAAAGAHRMAVAGGPWVEDVAGVHFVRPGPDGHEVVDRLPLTMIPAVPAYLVHRAFGGGRATSVLDLAYWPAGITAGLLMTGAAAAMAALLADLGRHRARVSAGLFALGTGAWSVAADGMWSHTTAVPALVVGMVGLQRDRPWVAGLGFGLAVASRPHLAVVAAAGGLAWAWQRWRLEPATGERLRILSGLAVVGVLSLLGVAVLMLWNAVTSPDGSAQVLSGVYGNRGDALGAVGDAAVRDHLGNIALLLVSPIRGLLPYTPIALFVVPGLRSAWGQSSPWLRAAAVGGVAYIVLQGLVNAYTGGDAFFGNRLALEALAVWWPLLAVAGWVEWDRRPARRGPLVVAAGLSVCMHALGATVFHLGPPNL